MAAKGEKPEEPVRNRVKKGSPGSESTQSTATKCSSDGSSVEEVLGKGKRKKTVKALKTLKVEESQDSPKPEPKEDFSLAVVATGSNNALLFSGAMYVFGLTFFRYHISKNQRISNARPKSILSTITYKDSGLGPMKEGNLSGDLARLFKPQLFYYTDARGAVVPPGPLQKDLDIEYFERTALAFVTLWNEEQEDAADHKEARRAVFQAKILSMKSQKCAPFETGLRLCENGTVS